MCLMRTLKLVCWLAFLAIGCVVAFFVGGVIGVLYIQPVSSNVLTSSQKAFITENIPAAQVIQVGSFDFVSWGFVGVASFLGFVLVVYMVYCMIWKTLCGVVKIPVTMARQVRNYRRRSNARHEEEMLKIDSSFMFSA